MGDAAIQQSLNRAGEQVSTQAVEDEGFIRESGIPGEVAASPEIVQAMEVYLEREIEDVWQGAIREEYLDRVRTWRLQRKGQPLERSKDTPFKGASNVSTPMTMQNTNAVGAKLKGSVQNRDPRIQVEAFHPDYKEHAKVLEKVFNRLNTSPLHIDIETLDDAITYETGSLGTVTVEVPWVSEQLLFKRRSKTGEGWEEATKVIYEGPKPEVALLEHFLIRPEWDDVQKAPWCAFVRPMMAHDVKYQFTRGFFGEEFREVLEGSPRTELPDTLEEELARRGFQESINDAEDKSYDIMKVYMKWDVDDSGTPYDCIVWYAYDAKRILRIEYNQMGYRPIVTFRYRRVFGEYYGMGLGEMSEFMQREVDTAHNMRIDGTKLHSLQMFVTDTSSGIKPNEKMHPGKIWAIPGGADKLKSIQFPDVTIATEKMEAIARQYVDISAGISDLQKGMPDTVGKSGSRASSVMMQVQRGDSIFDSITKDFRKAYGTLYQYEIMQCVVNGPRAKQYISTLAETPEEARLLDEVWDMNVEDIPYRFAFSVRTSKAEETKDAKRQNIMTMIQLFNMFTQDIIQTQMALESGQLPPETTKTMIKVMSTKYKLMDQVFELLNPGDDKEELMPYYENLSLMNDMIELQERMATEQAKGAIANERNRVAGPSGASPQGLGGPVGQTAEPAGVGPGPNEQGAQGPGGQVEGSPQGGTSPV